MLHFQTPQPPNKQKNTKAPKLVTPLVFFNANIIQDLLSCQVEVPPRLLWSKHHRRISAWTLSVTQAQGFTDRAKKEQTMRQSRELCLWQKICDSHFVSGCLHIINLSKVQVWLNRKVGSGVPVVLRVPVFSQCNEHRQWVTPAPGMFKPLVLRTHWKVKAEGAAGDRGTGGLVRLPLWARLGQPSPRRRSGLAPGPPWPLGRSSPSRAGCGEARRGRPCPPRRCRPLLALRGKAVGGAAFSRSGGSRSVGLARTRSARSRRWQRPRGEWAP